MATRHDSYSLNQATHAAELPGTAVLEPFLRRLAGDGIVNLFRARTEVLATLRAFGDAVPPAPPLPDALPAQSIPSVASGRYEDRVLAEIDQDGYAFAAEPIDEPYFNRRAHRRPRQMNLIDIALVDGHVCVRKRFRGFRMGARRWGDRRVPASDRASRSLWVSLGFFLYSEAAALLRMHDLPFIPKLRRLDIAERSLYVDYVQGLDLRSQAAAATGKPVHDHDLAGDPELSALSAAELGRREVALLDQAVGADYRAEIAEMAREINARGVAPLDIKLGNFIRGTSTGRLYWIDFEICRLQSQPRWEADLLQQREILEELFELNARGHTVV